MKMRSRIIILFCALAVAGAWLLWPHGGAPSASTRQKPAASAPAASVAPAPAPGHTAPVAKAAVSLSANSTNRFAFRLTNTPKTIGQLTGDRHAILLQNALIATDVKTDLAIPKQLRATGEPGAFIVQARGLIGAAFRAALGSAGGQIVSYIPNNAYLVQLTSAGAAALAGNPLVQAVLPYEPYYKVQSSLLDAAVNQKPLPAGTYLTLGLYGSSAAATEAQIQSLGGQIVGRDRSPFGTIVRVQPPADWIALAQLPGVQLVEPTHQRALANDLARVTIGMSPLSSSPPANDYLNSLGITGNNVIVEMNDTGVDTNHPDLSGRVLFDNPASGYDTDGHGTHVAGIIAGNGTKSTTVAPPFYAQGSTNPAQPFQFRGKATTATIYSVGGINGGNDNVPFPEDQYFQEAPARTNALISNNSWVNGGSYEYDLSAASYDAAVRDALPEVSGSQPVLFVFAAGNDGGGSDDGAGGNADTVASPGTAKNVITVGALEQNRGITNTYVDIYGVVHEPWYAATDTGTEVAWYSARGNVGVGTEGTFGRFKPDVVAPGSFVVSTRSVNWAGVYNLTNTFYYVPQNPLFPYVDTNYSETFQLPIPISTVGLTITIEGNGYSSPIPFPNLDMYFSGTQPNPGPGNSDYESTNNTFTLPPSYLQTLATNGVLYVTVVDTTTNEVDFTLFETISMTNDYAYEIAMSNLDYSLGPWYRYDSGTSMATPAVSGVLALMQDYFTNKLSLTPSPALLKAMIINGAREDGNYGYAVNGDINMEGWGLINLSNSLPASPIYTTSLNNNFGATTPLFFADQSSANTLATGDSRTYTVTVPANSQGLPLRLTLAWTDPPGNPAAAFKLVNNLELVVTNLTTGQIYYGNNFDSSTPTYTVASRTNDTPVLDSVNNVQNIVIPSTLAAKYSVTVIGQSVNVNAVTTEQTNVVQDYALVIASDDATTGGISVAAPASASATTPPRVTYVSGTFGLFFDELAGANAPLLSTNTLAFNANSGYVTNAVLYIGQTNQWHFYVFTNTTTFTNAAFVTFIPNTMAIPREGVFANRADYDPTLHNPTLPEANLDIYVATTSGDPNAANLINLDPTVLQSCISGLNGDSANLARGGTKFVAFSNAQPNQVYYVGVKCEDQMAGEYGFLGAFNQNPFSQMDTNGNELVNGIIVTNAPTDGGNWKPGVGYVLGLAEFPIDVRNVVVTNSFASQNFGDLLGFLSHGADGKYPYTTLNNHNEMWGPGYFTLAYDDGVTNGMTGAIHSDGPGTLQNFSTSQGAGVWDLVEIDDGNTQTSSVTSMTIELQPHQPTNTLTTVIVPGGGWYYEYVTVPVGATNLLVVATNETPPYNQGIQLAIQYGTQPDTNYNLAIVTLDQGGPPPGNSISLGPPLVPGTYWIGLYNPSAADVSVLFGYFLSFDTSSLMKVAYLSTDTPLPVLDDAITASPAAEVNYGLTNSTIHVPRSDIIQGFSVGLRVDHPRISDLVFTLIDPSGNRYLLMENRGSTSANCGATVITTNIVNVTANGNWQPNTNVVNVGFSSGIFPITYNFYTAPDEMWVYYGTNVTPSLLIYDTGYTHNPPNPVGPPSAQNTLPITFTVVFPPAGVPPDSTYITIVMNQNATTPRGTAWVYTAGGVLTNYEYLNFTEDTNLTTTPIKFAPTPFVPQTQTSFVTTTTYTTNYTFGATVMSDGFDNAVPGSYGAGQYVSGWQVISNNVNILNGPDPASAPNYLELFSTEPGAIQTNITTIVGQSYQLSFAYAKNPVLANTSAIVQVDITGQTSFQVSNNAANSLANLEWATNVSYFMASSSNTTLQFIGLNTTSGGMFLDSVSVAIATPIVTSSNTVTPETTWQSLYYQPEQSLTPLNGTSAFGDWQLEVLDNRTGANIPAPVLQSWELEFTFSTATTTAVAANLVANNIATKAAVGAGIGGSRTSQFSWTAAVGAHYEVQWKNSLSAPWNTITNPITTMVNGVSTFSDNGSQTAPFTGSRFYRIVQTTVGPGQVFPPQFGGGGD